MDSNEFLKIESLLFNDEKLDGISKEEIEGFQNYILDTLNIDKRIFYTHYILLILNEAKQLNEKEYLNNVFLEWVYIQRKASTNKARIFKALTALANIADKNEYISQIIDLYRSVVSELIDPYLTLLYASIKFKEGNFTTLTNANYEQGEVNKYEYIKSRDSSEAFLHGYNSNVRNAISHNNTDSISFIEDKIIFKDIKRTVPPRVTLVEWDLKTLENNLNDLLEFILSTDVCMNIFGLDSSRVIIQNIDLLFQFIQKTMSQNERREQRTNFSKPLNEIFYNANLKPIDKFNVLNEIYTNNLTIRDMSVLKVGFNENNDCIIIEIPIEQYNFLDDQELLDRAIIFSRYAIIARGIFGELYPGFIVRELDESKTIYLNAFYLGTDLKDWIDEKSGLFDLLNDSKHYLKNSLIEFHVDFEKKKEVEDLLLGEIYPSKRR